MFITHPCGCVCPRHRPRSIEVDDGVDFSNHLLYCCAPLGERSRQRAACSVQQAVRPYGDDRTASRVAHPGRVLGKVSLGSSGVL